eukprot:gnl/Hemi2/21195_TR7025_c0_g1_i1.p1 gnl/Hemi2/21195_TR7025_c0_g1~~gnl/Hemi2/21195_TR7025_c0_g1_i1.p1  ORF type:complete len:178 (-),score=19.11 gnl/Hemi2/21195_TR7025_c0_g1_i1:86-583(-)
MAEVCGVCTTAPWKYKCPTCGIKYCSVVCCKAHKDGCGKAGATPQDGPAPSSSVDTAPQTMDVDAAPEAGDATSFTQEMRSKLDSATGIHKQLGQHWLRNVINNIQDSPRPDKTLANTLKKHRKFEQFVHELLVSIGVRENEPPSLPEQPSLQQQLAASLQTIVS